MTPSSTWYCCDHLPLAEGISLVYGHHPTCPATAAMQAALRLSGPPEDESESAYIAGHRAGLTSILHHVIRGLQRDGASNLEPLHLLAQIEDTRVSLRMLSKVLGCDEPEDDSNFTKSPSAIEQERSITRSAVFTAELWWTKLDLLMKGMGTMAVDLDRLGVPAAARAIRDLLARAQAAGETTAPAQPGQVQIIVPWLICEGRRCAPRQGD